MNAKQAFPLERWMWVYLEGGGKPEWAHKGIDHQDLRDMIAKAIRTALEDPKP